MISQSAFNQTRLALGRTTRGPLSKSEILANSPLARLSITR